MVVERVLEHYSSTVSQAQKEMRPETFYILGEK